MMYINMTVPSNEIPSDAQMARLKSNDICLGTSDKIHILMGGWCPFCGSIYYYPGWGKYNMEHAKKYRENHKEDFLEKGVS